MSPGPPFRIDPTLSTPIWSQIEEGIRRLVASSSLPPGGPVLSVRDLARELRVNPNTVAKAYQRLAESGVLEPRRGEGTFVSTRPPQMTAAQRSRALREATTRFVSHAVTLGVGRDEALAAVETGWPEPQHPRGGKR
jgi:GntR family transcriptional regulator